MEDREMKPVLYEPFSLDRDRLGEHKELELRRGRFEERHPYLNKAIIVGAGVGVIILGGIAGKYLRSSLKSFIRD